MRKFLAAALVLVLAALPVHGQEGFFFQPKDRILFLGDSITEQYQYSSTIELYLTTRFPTWGLTFLNAGIGGDTATGGAGRFQTHVLNEHPTAITINFGMNDGGYGKLNLDARDKYAKNTEKMLDMAKKAGVRVALLSPNAVDRRVQERFKLYLETQKDFYAPLKELAEKYGDRFVDQYAITRAALEKMEADGATKVIPFGDGFHTSPNGGLFMAHAILTGLNAPAVVSDVSLDVSQAIPKKVNKDDGLFGVHVTIAKGAKVANVDVSDAGVIFDRTDNALPIPIAKDWASLLPYVNNLKDLNWYGLTVKGLPAKEYQLSIDGKEVARFTSKELAEGVNLGNLQTGPLFDKGQEIFKKINDKNKIVHARFRGVVMAQIPDFLKDIGEKRRAEELQKRLATIQEKQAEIYQMVRPTSLRFELKAVK